MLKYARNKLYVAVGNELNMAILSKRILAEVGRLYCREYGLRPFLMDHRPYGICNRQSGASLERPQEEDYALQESLNLGGPVAF